MKLQQKQPCPVRLKNKIVADEVVAAHDPQETTCSCLAASWLHVTAKLRLQSRKPSKTSSRRHGESRAFHLGVCVMCIHAIALLFAHLLNLFDLLVLECRFKSNTQST
jgi:hypothetical protein